MCSPKEFPGILIIHLGLVLDFGENFVLVLKDFNVWSREQGRIRNSEKKKKKQIDVQGTSSSQRVQNSSKTHAGSALK